MQKRSWCKNEVGAKTKLVQKRSWCKNEVGAKTKFLHSTVQTQRNKTRTKTSFWYNQVLFKQNLV
ncbi:hypothetical protein EON70_00660 [bacterium]|nr:MAG: hypothetical protein EON70_00660 [bacterium]